MGALDRLETFLQDLVERPAALFMPKRLHPLKLVSALNKELESRALRLADRVVIPSTYDILVSVDDWSDLNDIKATLENELSDYVARLAAERGLSLRSAPRVSIQQSEAIHQGEVRARAAFESALDRATPARLSPFGHDGQPDSVPRTESPPRAQPSATEHAAVPRRPPAPALVLIDGDGNEMTRFPVGRKAITIGRSSTCDVAVADSKASRQHARVEGDTTGNYFITDLDSTNGTWVNGGDVKYRQRLTPGDIIQVGTRRFRFEL